MKTTVALLVTAMLGGCATTANLPRSSECKIIYNTYSAKISHMDKKYAECILYQSIPECKSLIKYYTSPEPRLLLKRMRSCHNDGYINGRGLTVVQVLNRKSIAHTDFVLDYLEGHNK